MFDSMAWISNKTSLILEYTLQTKNNIKTLIAVSVNFLAGKGRLYKVLFLTRPDMNLMDFFCGLKLGATRN